MLTPIMAIGALTATAVPANAAGSDANDVDAIAASVSIASGDLDRVVPTQADAGGFTSSTPGG